MALTYAQHLSARRGARFHLQARIESTGDLIDETAAPVRLELHVRVVRVFRGAERLPIGTALRFCVPVVQAGQLAAPGLKHEDIDAAKRACYIEAYLDGEPSELRLVEDEFEFIAAPTEQSVLDDPQLGSATAPLVARPWWRRWF